MKRDLDALRAPHDVLVVGGGIHGAAIVWDAAQRGLRAALVEAADFGGALSWNSLKTVHGGLRYLQTMDLARARESVRERRALLRIAPDLVRPLPFLVPTYGHGLKGREAFGLGLLLNDLVSADRNAGLRADRRIESGRLLSRDDVRARVPGIDSVGLTGGALWHDAQLVSSERLVTAFLSAAAAAGAHLANRVEVVGFRRTGRAVTGVLARDHETNEELEIPARMVVTAAGAGFEGLCRLAGVKCPKVPLLRARNLVLRRAVFPSAAIGGRHRGRYLFLVPWRDFTLAGTSYDPDRDDAPGPEDLLSDLQAAFPWAGLEREEVVLVHEGLVPGESADRLWGQGLVIDHDAEEGTAGLVSVLGVKLTTARAVAERVVDLVGGRLGLALPRCRTAVTPLPARLPSGAIADEARRAVRNEMALHLSDAVLRRMDLGTAGPPLPGILDAVVAVLAEEHGWDTVRVAAEREALESAFSTARTPSRA